jgi:hypothetical protein
VSFWAAEYERALPGCGFAARSTMLTRIACIAVEWVRMCDRAVTGVALAAGRPPARAAAAVAAMVASRPPRGCRPGRAERAVR